MKIADVEYYNEQINSFTPCVATKKRNHITVIFPNQKKKTAYTEIEADQLWKECSKSLTEEGGNRDQL